MISKNEDSILRSLVSIAPVQNSTFENGQLYRLSYLEKDSWKRDDIISG